jgi:soluble lytic murein transglycosylase-like protein
MRKMYLALCSATFCLFLFTVSSKNANPEPPAEKIQVEEEIQIEIEDTSIPGVVTRIAKEVGVDPAVALALLKEENPGMAVDAVHRNSNGSRDLGLFQLNDTYIYSDFVPAYWNIGEQFDPFDLESNSYVALRHLKFLLDRYDGNVVKAVCAYNAGMGSVRRNVIPQTTIAYSQRISRSLGIID